LPLSTGSIAIGAASGHLSCTSPAGHSDRFRERVFWTP
jgi:hypothetical protein